MTQADVTNFGKEENLVSEEKCVAHLESVRWPQGVRCPSCGGERISHINAKGAPGKVRRLYQCLEKTCRYQFSPTTGTIFHDSHLPLSKWFTAIRLVCQSQEPISVNHLRLMLGVQYKTAQHVTSRIHLALETGTIEMDEERKGVLPSPPASSHKPPAPLPPAQETPSFIPAIPAAAVGEATLGSVLNIFTSLAQLTIRTPLVVANYLISKVSIDT